ncbi:hypothetical protein ACPA9J_08135 [Pseudomonas aeruginosa]
MLTVGDGMVAGAGVADRHHRRDPSSPGCLPTNQRTSAATSANGGGAAEQRDRRPVAVLFGLIPVSPTLTFLALRAAGRRRRLLHALAPAALPDQRRFPRPAGAARAQERRAPSAKARGKGWRRQAEAGRLAEQEEFALPCRC